MPLLESVLNVGRLLQYLPADFDYTGARPFLTYGGRRLETTSDDAFWPTGAASNDTYTPSSNVLNGHKLTNSKFALTAAYVQQVLTIPIIFLVLGIVSCMFTNLGLCFRCCCRCCKCLPKEKGDTQEERVHSVKTQKRGWYVLFGVLAVFVVVADFLCYYGYNFIDDGVNKFFDAMSLLYNIANNVNTYATIMSVTDVAALNAGSTQAQSTCCSSISQSTYPVRYQLCVTSVNVIVDSVPVFASATSTVSTLVSPFRTIISSFISLAKQYLMDLRKLAIFVIFAIALLEVIMLVGGAICQSRRFMKFAIFWGMLFYVIIVLLCCPFMIFTSALADLCTNPARNLARQVTGSTRSLIVYYATCSGEDKIKNNVEKAKSTIITIATQVASMKANFCPGDPSISIFNGAIDDIGTQIGNLAQTVSCQSLRKVLLTFLNDSLCGGIYSGIYSIWISQLITSFFLLMLLITSTVLYQYFGQVGKVIAGFGDGEGGETAAAYKADDADGVYAVPVQGEEGYEMAKMTKSPTEDDMQDMDMGVEAHQHHQVDAHHAHSEEEGK